MPDRATNAPSPSRATDMLLVFGVLAGAALTAVGWLSARAGTWQIADHGTWFAWLWAAATVLVLGFRMHPAAAAAALGGAAALASGQLAALLSVGLLCWAATTAGRILLARYPAATAVECLLLGLAGFATLVGFLVHYPVNYTATYAALLAAPLVLGRRHAAQVLTSVQHCLARVPSRRPLLDVLGAAAAALAVVHLLVAMMPEVGHDALVTHLLLPARIAWDHHWAFDVDRYVWTVMPMVGDWLYTIGYVLAGETGARFVNLACILVLAALIRDLVRWAFGDRRSATFAVLLYLSTPLTLTESSSLFIEAAWSCMVLGGTLGLLRLLTREPAGTPPDRRHLVVAGALLGGALAAKAVTFMVLPVLFAMLVLGYRRWLRRDRAGQLATGLLLFVAIGSVPYVRAFWLTGNPVFPFFNGYFRSPHYAPENFAPPDVFERGTTWDVLYRITFDSMHYLEARPGAAGFQWLLLVAPVALWLLATRQRRGLLLLALAGAIAWLTFRQTAYLRYVFPSFALAAAAVGIALRESAGPAHTGRRLLLVALLAAVTLNIIRFDSGTYYGTLRLAPLASPSARSAYLTERVPLRAAVRLVNELNDQRAPVAFFGPAFATDLHADALFPNWYNFRFLERVRTARTPEQLGELLARERVRYLLLVADWEDEAMRARVRACSHEVHRVGNVSVRRLADDYRFRRELLLDPTFTSASAWRVVDGAHIEPGVGAIVTVDAPIVQQVAIEPGYEYRLTARVRSRSRSSSGEARLQVNWYDTAGNLVRADIEVVACLPQASVHSMDCIAPAPAVAAAVYATGHTSQPVIFESLSFRN